MKEAEYFPMGNGERGAPAGVPLPAGKAARVYVERDGDMKEIAPKDIRAGSPALDDRQTAELIQALWTEFESAEGRRSLPISQETNKKRKEGRT